MTNRELYKKTKFNRVVWEYLRKAGFNKYRRGRQGSANVVWIDLDRINVGKEVPEGYIDIFQAERYLNSCKKVFVQKCINFYGSVNSIEMCDGAPILPLVYWKQAAAAERSRRCSDSGFIEREIPNQTKTSDRYRINPKNYRQKLMIGDRVKLLHSKDYNIMCEGVIVDTKIYERTLNYLVKTNQYIDLVYRTASQLIKIEG